MFRSYHHRLPRDRWVTLTRAVLGEIGLKCPAEKHAYNATHEDQVDKDGEIISDLHSDIDDAHGSVDAPQPPVDTVRLRNIAARLGLMEEMRRNSTNIR